MKEPIIADTSGFFSLSSDTNRNHAIVITEGEKLFKVTGAIILPRDVFTEYKQYC